MESALAAAIEDRSCRVGIIGLGYVGLPLALVFAEAGFPVVGFDVDAQEGRAAGGRRQLYPPSEHGSSA